jgi:hypothetical protein
MQLSSRASESHARPSILQPPDFGRMAGVFLSRISRDRRDQQSSRQGDVITLGLVFYNLGW